MIKRRNKNKSLRPKVAVGVILKLVRCQALTRNIIKINPSKE